MAVFRMEVTWVEETRYHLDIEAESAEAAEEAAREMWDDGSWRDRAVEDEYSNAESDYGIGEA